ncbi:hypothetical protein NFI96_003056 [Prochilodus magdalenae]|nr:hypothetical protein NFI96_003056 [Prochilodus magdalenae]
MERKIPDFSGTWKMKSSENFEELLKALGGAIFMVYWRYPDGVLLQSDVLVYGWSYLHGVLEIPGWCSTPVRGSSVQVELSSWCTGDTRMVSYSSQMF